MSARYPVGSADANLDGEEWSTFPAEEGGLLLPTLELVGQGHGAIDLMGRASGEPKAKQAGASFLAKPEHQAWFEGYAQNADDYFSGEEYTASLPMPGS